MDCISNYTPPFQLRVVRCAVDVSGSLSRQRIPFLYLFLFFLPLTFWVDEIDWHPNSAFEPDFNAWMV